VRHTLKKKKIKWAQVAATRKKNQKEMEAEKQNGTQSQDLQQGVKKKKTNQCERY